MAKVQTRRSVSLAAVAYDALHEHATIEGKTASQVVVEALRRIGIDIPETTHQSRTSTVKAQRNRDRLRGHKRRHGAHKRTRAARVVTSKQVTAPMPPTAIAPTHRDEVDRALAEAREAIPWRGSGAAEERERDISRKAAEIMRERGILRPENEGYAPGSWADPKRCRLTARPAPKLDEHGVPHCTGARCPNRTPKDRCAITGENLGTVCEPAVRELVATVRCFQESTRG